MKRKEVESTLSKSGLVPDIEKKQLEVIQSASIGNIERLKELKAEGHSLSLGDYDKRTPLHLAASEGHLETVKFLIDQGVDPNPIDRFGNTPVTDSLRYQFNDIAKFLISKGGQVSKNEGLQASWDLCQAAKDGDLTKVQALVAGGVNVNVGDYDSRTGLHLAAAEGSYEIAEYLVQCGANVNVADRWGCTPLKEAINKKHLKMIQLFLNSGAINVDIAKFKNLPPFVSSMQQILILLCEKQDWKYGAAWVFSEDGSHLCPSGAWYAHSQHVSKLAQFHQCQDAVPIGVGVVGTAAKLKSYVWLQNQKQVNETMYPPNSSLKMVVSGLAFPIMYNSEVIGVLEFYSFTERPKNEQVIQEAMRTSTSMIVTDILSHLSELKKVTLGVIQNEQSVVVYRILLSAGTFSDTTITSAVDWYYHGLGLPPTYFKIHSPQLIAQHVSAFMTAKFHAKTNGGTISYRLEEEDYGLYFSDSKNYTKLLKIERRIEEHYLNEGYETPNMELTKNSGICIKYYLSTGNIDPESSSKLAMYLVSSDIYVNPNPPADTTDIFQVATGACLRDADTASRERFQRGLSEHQSQMTVGVNWEKKCSLDPLWNVVHITYQKGTTHSYYSSLTTLMKLNHVTCPSKVVREFSNGVTQYVIYVTGKEEDISEFTHHANLLYILPRTSLFPLLEEEKLTAEEVVYAYAGWKFVYHFLNKSSEEYTQLWDRLRDDEINRNRLIRLKQTIRTEAATEAKVQQVIMSYPDLIKLCYAEFSERFKPRSGTYRPHTPNPNSYLTIKAKIEHDVPQALDCLILQEFLVFNQHVIKTNFYKSAKSALAVQLNPAFLSTDYPVQPYSIILFLGAEFRGFHVRFEPIARGGLRLIKSANFHNLVKNAENLFSENYNLAYTQQRKNKDIPEGGSKGTILLSMTHQNKAEVAFRKYIDSMLDLLVTSTKADPEIVDHLNKEDYIFCGPDEGTADMMDWAARHAKTRGYKYWSAFTTGKSTQLGGIPHDVYGMTTRGVHQFVLGLMAKKGITEEKVFKVQTGGPDGDLGSNEILISKDKTKAIVDGSGVLYDKQGLDREELRRLANSRLMVSQFDRKKLSKEGFLVLLSDRDVVLPDGYKIEVGMNFRNSFHVTPYAACDFFVPCGGRPESVTIQNVNKIFINGEPIYKNIVEGANLFFTQEARLVLEAAGVPVFKDASANKGGVTSSSLEVLAALCFTEEEHEEHMCIKDGKIPQFYKDYVVEVQNKIEENARLEFECIWAEHTRSKEPMCTITDKLSEKINRLNLTISSSNLWNNHTIKNKVLGECFPKGLQKLLGLNEIVRRLPESYISATLSAHLASRYIYEFGLSPGEFSFYQFMQRYYN